MSALPTRYAPLAKMEYDRYEELKNQGYNSEDITCIYRGKVGNFATLKKEAFCLERTIRLVTCAIVTPFACLLTIATCCQCDEQTLRPCCDFVSAGVDGYHLETGFVADEKATLALRNRDFNALGFDSFSTPNMKRLVDSGQYQMIRSETCPQHYYLSFDGPVSGIPYIIVVPNGKTDGELLLFTAYNEQNKPCTAIELNKKAEILCAGYRKGVRNISTTTSFQPVGYSKTNATTVYGSMSATTTKYTKVTTIVST